MEETKAKFGLSRKTNVAIASVATIASAQNSLNAIIAISIIALVAITYQFVLDRRNQNEKSV